MVRHSSAQAVGKIRAREERGVPVRAAQPATGHPGSKKGYKPAPQVITRRGGNTWRAVTRARRSAPYLWPKRPEAPGWRR